MLKIKIRVILKKLKFFLVSKFCKISHHTDNLSRIYKPDGLECYMLTQTA